MSFVTIEYSSDMINGTFREYPVAGIFSKTSK